MNLARHLNRLHFGRFVLLASAGLAATAFACGGISDPTLNGGDGNVATVSGALTGTAVPANARVAIVWRKVTTTPSGTTGSVEVGSDVAVIDGKFTMNLGAPAADYFAPIDSHSVDNIASPPPLKDQPVPAPAPSGAGSSGGKFGATPKLAPRDVVGGSITEAMTAAIAGFVVYVDGNGNGKLDLEGKYASSPDQIIGGNKELILAYLKGGGALDYEKLRDKSGILPAAGFNLSWTQGERWLPLTVVELTLTNSAKLPSAVCESYVSGISGGSSGGGVATKDPSPDSSGSPGVPPSSGGSSGSSGSGGSSGSTPTGSYPSPSDPGLHCAPDGRSFTYYSTPSCPPPPPPAVGLCAPSYLNETAPCAGYGYTSSINAGDPIPSGWPCMVLKDADGGAADAGPFMDAGAGGG